MGRWRACDAGAGDRIALSLPPAVVDLARGTLRELAAAALPPGMSRGNARTVMVRRGRAPRTQYPGAPRGSVWYHLRFEVLLRGPAAFARLTLRDVGTLVVQMKELQIGAVLSVAALDVKLGADECRFGRGETV